MADNGSISIKFEINGGQEAVKGVRDVGNALNMLNERLKTNRAGLDNWGASATKMEQYEENLRSKLKALEGGIAQNTEKLKTLYDEQGNLTQQGLRVQATLEKWKRAEQETTQELQALNSGLYEQNGVIATTERNIENIESELRVYSSELERNKYSVEALTNSKNALSSKLQNERALEESLNTALQTASEIYDKNSNEIKEYTQAHNRASEAVAETKKQIAELEARINNLDYTKAADGLNQLGNFASSVGQAFQLASSAAATAVKASVDNVINYEKAFTGVRKTTDDVAAGYYGLQEVLKDTTMTFEEFSDEFDRGTKRAQEATAAGYNKIKEDLQDLATTTASTVEQIMKVGEYAGQLGIPADQIAAFTEVVVKMGDSTSYGTEEAALSLARLGNVLMDSGLSADEAAEWYNKLGSVIVDLGNNAAALEPEIGNVLQRIAAVGKQSKFTTAELAALSTALVSTGIKEEAGGTALMNTISQIEKAVAGAGDKLKNFAKVSGMSAKEFAIAWKTEPMTAMQEFLKGLQKLSDGTIKSHSEIEKEVKNSTDKITKNLEKIAAIAGMTGEEFKQAWTEDSVKAMQAYQEGLENVEIAGENAVTTLADLGINSKRQTQAVLSLAASEEELETYLKRANDEWERGKALNVESGKFYEITAASVSQMREAWSTLSATMGESVSPIIYYASQALTELAKTLTDLPAPILAIGEGLLTVTSLISPLAFEVANITMSISGLMKIAESTSDSVFVHLAQKIVDPFKGVGVKITDAGTEADNAVKKGFIAKIQTGLKDASTGIGKALDWAFAPFKNIGKFFSELFKGIGSTLSTAFTPLITKMGEFAKLLISPFTTVFANLGSVFSSELGLIASKITPLLSTLSSLAGTAAPIIAVAGGITLVVGALTQLGGGTEEVKAKIENFASTFTEKFSNFAAELPSKLESVFSTISETAPQILDTVIDALSNGLPKLMQSGAEILTTIATAIADNLPSLIESAVSIIETLVDALIENLPEILGAAAEIIVALVEGIVKSLPDILEAGGKIIGKLVEALTEGIVSLVKAGAELAKSVIDAIEKGWEKVYKIGENFITGIINGITAGWKKLKEKVQGVVDSIKGLFTGASGFDEHSPSKWAENVAELVDEGLAIGFEKGTRIVLNAVDNVVTSIQDVIRDLPTKYFNVGKKTAKNLAKGIKSGMKSVSTNVKAIAKETIGSIEVIDGDFKEAGKEAAKNFKDGMNALKKATISDFESTVKGVINAVSNKKNKTELNKAGSELIKAFKDSINKETKALIDEYTNTVNELAEKAKAAYQEIIKQQEALYKKMSDISGLFSEDKLPSLSSLIDQTEQIKQYGENLNILKDKIPDSLMETILSKDVQTGLKYTSELLSMSEDQLAAYVEAINNLESAANMASANFYQQDLANIEAQFNADLKDAMEQLAADAKQYGVNVVQGLIDGMKSRQKALKGAAKDLATTVSGTLQSELKIASPSKVANKIGRFFVDGFANAFTGYGIDTLKDVTTRFADFVGTTLSDKLSDINESIHKNIDVSFDDLGKLATSNVKVVLNDVANAAKSYSDVIFDDVYGGFLSSAVSSFGSLMNPLISGYSQMFGNMASVLVGNFISDPLQNMLAQSTVQEYIGSFISNGFNMLMSDLQKEAELETQLTKTVFEDLFYSASDLLSRYIKNDAYADSYYFGETMVAGIADGVDSSEKVIYNSFYDSIKNALSGASKAYNDGLEAINDSLTTTQIGKFLSQFEGIIDTAFGYVFDAGEAIIGFLDKDFAKLSESFGGHYFQYLDQFFNSKEDPIPEKELNIFDSILGALDKLFGSGSSIGQLLSANESILSLAQNVSGSLIDYDRLAEIIGDRSIYLGERLVGRELRNMGVQFV